MSKQTTDKLQVPLLIDYQQRGFALRNKYALHAAIDLKDVGSKSPLQGSHSDSAPSNLSDNFSA